MLKSKFTLVGIIIIIFAVYMQYRGGAGEWSSMLNPAHEAGGGAAIPPIASGYVKAEGTQAVQPTALKPFETDEYEKLSAAVARLVSAKLNAGKTLSDYKDECVNIFATKITSSKEHGLEDENDGKQKAYNVILNSTDINYVGYYNTPKGMTAIVKVKQSGASVLRAGDVLGNTNLKLKALNERYAVFENMASRSD
ncbi:MAG TPA: hypothetical protein PKL57_09790, partial [Candidatus Wallbacteria bacterium]|nr:hypothetical protein [Candidatus Wallbacteria bacterium]